MMHQPVDDDTTDHVEQMASLLEQLARAIRNGVYYEADYRCVSRWENLRTWERGPIRRFDLGERLTLSILDPYRREEAMEELEKVNARRYAR